MAAPPLQLQTEPIRAQPEADVTQALSRARTVGGGDQEHLLRVVQRALAGMMHGSLSRSRRCDRAGHA